MDQMNPRELTGILLAYTESDLMTDEFLDQFDHQFRSKFEYMNPEDISKYYYCFTKNGHKGSGRFYKYL